MFAQITRLPRPTSPGPTRLRLHAATPNWTRPDWPGSTRPRYGISVIMLRPTRVPGNYWFWVIFERPENNVELLLSTKCSKINRNFAKKMTKKCQKIDTQSINILNRKDAKKCSKTSSISESCRKRYQNIKDFINKILSEILKSGIFISKI